MNRFVMKKFLFSVFLLVCFAQVASAQGPPPPPGGTQDYVHETMVFGFGETSQESEADAFAARVAYLTEVQDWCLANGHVFVSVEIVLAGHISAEEYAEELRIVIHGDSSLYMPVLPGNPPQIAGIPEP